MSSRKEAIQNRLKAKISGKKKPQNTSALAASLASQSREDKKLHSEKNQPQAFFFQDLTNGFNFLQAMMTGSAESKRILDECSEIQEEPNPDITVKKIESLPEFNQLPADKKTALKAILKICASRIYYNKLLNAFYTLDSEANLKLHLQTLLNRSEPIGQKEFLRIKNYAALSLRDASEYQGILTIIMKHFRSDEVFEKICVPVTRSIWELKKDKENTREYFSLHPEEQIFWQHYMASSEFLQGEELCHILEIENLIKPFFDKEFALFLKYSSVPAASKRAIGAVVTQDVDYSGAFEETIDKFEQFLEDVDKTFGENSKRFEDAAKLKDRLDKIKSEMAKTLPFSSIQSAKGVFKEIVAFHDLIDALQVEYNQQDKLLTQEGESTAVVSIESAELVGTVGSAESEESAGSEKSVSSVRSVESAGLEQSVGSAGSVESAGLEQSVGSVRSEESVKSAGLLVPVKSAESAESTESTGSMVPAKSAESRRSAKSAGSAELTESTVSVSAGSVPEEHSEAEIIESIVAGAKKTKTAAIPINASTPIKEASKEREIPASTAGAIDPSETKKKAESAESKEKLASSTQGKPKRAKTETKATTNAFNPYFDYKAALNEQRKSSSKDHSLSKRSIKLLEIIMGNDEREIPPLGIKRSELDNVFKQLGGNILGRGGANIRYELEGYWGDINSLESNISKPDFRHQPRSLSQHARHGGDAQNDKVSKFTVLQFKSLFERAGIRDLLNEIKKSNAADSSRCPA